MGVAEVIYCNLVDQRPNPEQREGVAITQFLLVTFPEFTSLLSKDLKLICGTTNVANADGIGTSGLQSIYTYGTSK